MRHSFVTTFFSGSLDSVRFALLPVTVGVWTELVIILGDHNFLPSDNNL